MVSPNPDLRTGTATKSMHIGLGAVKTSDVEFQIGFSVSDGVFSIDFAVRAVNAHVDHLDEVIQSHVVEGIEGFSTRHLAKFVSAGISASLLELCPRLPSVLWAKMDILPLVVPTGSDDLGVSQDDSETPADEGADSMTGLLSVVAATGSYQWEVPDEVADSVLRKALVWIGPNKVPRVSIVSRGLVDVDAGGIQMCDLADYKASAGEPIWRALTRLTDELKEKEVRLAFFSVTPQGGRVARMRHALIRFFRQMGVSAAWYVPRPSPAISRITQTNHDILRGVAYPSARLTNNNKEAWFAWIERNAYKYWMSEGGPLAAGGADVIIIDDHEMAPLIPIIKHKRPKVPIIYRSHIEVRTALTLVNGSPQHEVWDCLWNNIKQCDIFIADPVKGCVPPDVPREMVAMMPATTDWLDGLNKNMAKWDLRYYDRRFAELCVRDGLPKLAYPARGYICQIAPFDHSNDLTNVLDSYRRLRERLSEAKVPTEETPQLLIAGNIAIDDPDSPVIYEQTLKATEAGWLQHLKDDIVIMRLGPSDQMLNTLLSNSQICLQLSQREGFEVKVSEALHKGIPVVGYRAGGIPAQIQDGKNGFLVDPGDNTSAAARLWDLWTDKGLYDRMSDQARCSVSDEVHTVGNAACWAYLACMFSRGVRVQPGGMWVYDLMRDEVGEPFEKDEPKLQR